MSGHNFADSPMADPNHPVHRERQEQSQREADEQKAEEEYRALLRRLGPLVLNREWPDAMERINEAAEEPVLFPVSAKVAALRRQLSALRRVPEEVMDSYQRQINQEVLLRLEDGAVNVEILELRPEGLRVAQKLYSDEGIPRGSVEREIPFSALSHEEVMGRLENFVGASFDLYRALMMYRRGDREACRAFLEAADNALSQSVRDFLFRPIELPTPRLVPGEEEEEPFSTPRFELEPTPASP
jgi:hypothetical protein